MSYIFHVFGSIIYSLKIISECAISLELYSENSVLDRRHLEIQKFINFDWKFTFHPFFLLKFHLDVLFSLCVWLERKFLT